MHFGGKNHNHSLLAVGTGDFPGFQALRKEDPRVLLRLTLGSTQLGSSGKEEFPPTGEREEKLEASLMIH